MRLGVLVGILVLGAAAPARAVVRLDWRGVTTSGRAPVKLDAAIRAHLAVALRPLGMLLVGAPPADAEGDATCQFLLGPPRLGRCMVEVVHSPGGERAERRVDIPYRDADDLAESIALLVADMLGSDLHDILTPSPGSIEPEPEPEPEPAPTVARPPAAPPAAPSTASTPPRRGSPPSVRPVTSRPLVLPPEATAPSRPGSGKIHRSGSAARPRTPRSAGHLVLDGGPTLAFGFGSEPLLGGVALRALYAGPVALRIGGALSVTGGARASGSYQLSFTRLVTGPRAGAGFARGRWRGDLTAGPALLLLATSAQPGGDHTMVSFAVVVGARLAVVLKGPLALSGGFDLTGAITDERVVAGPSVLADFGRLSLEATVGLAYRR